MQAHAADGWIDTATHFAAEEYLIIAKKMKPNTKMLLQYSGPQAAHSL